MKKSVNMPKKEKRKKKLKVVKIEKEIPVRHFHSSAEKQIVFKEYSQHFLHWASWQRRIILCKCTSHCSMSLLVSLSTTMEPVFHRDYQVLNFGSFKSSLINEFSPRGPEKREVEETFRLVPKNRNWQLPMIHQNNEIYQRDKIANAFMVKQDPFVNIELDEVPLRNEDSHHHSDHRHKDSVSTLDFFWKYQQDKVGSLGSFVKVCQQQGEGPKGKALNEYKHKVWWLPPISNSQPLQRASRGTLLQSFKVTEKEIISSFLKWKNAEQGDFILTLFELCTVEELLFLGNCIQQRLKEIGDIHRLPDKVLSEVFSYLDKTDLYNCSRVCKKWKLLALHNDIWKRRSYDLAEKYKQHAVLKHLESMSSNLLWINIYKELSDTVEQLTNLLVLQDGTANENSNDGEDNLSEILEDENTDDLNLDETGEAGSLDSSLESIEILHLSPKKVFTTAAADENAKSTALPTKKKTCEDQEEQTETQEIVIKKHGVDVTNDQAYDVRPKLIQPTNKIIVPDNVLLMTKKVALNANEEYIRVPIQGVTSLKRVRKLQGHLEAVLSVQFDKKRVMTGSLDRTVRLWDVRSGRCFYKLKGHQGGVRCLQFDEEYIVTGSWDTTVMVWHVSRFHLLHTITEHKGSISCLELNSSLLITASHDMSICIFERGTWELLNRLTGHQGPVSCMCLVSDDKLLTGSHDMRLFLWDIYEGTVLKEFHHQKSPILAAKVCGNLVAAGCLDGSLTFWSMTTTSVEGSMKAHFGAVHALCFVGTRFVTGGADGLVKEWDLGTCTCIRSLTGHRGPVLCVRASPKRIISGSSDGTIRIWDMVCGMQQIGGPYEDMNKIVIPSQVVSEREWKDRKLLYEEA